MLQNKKICRLYLNNVNHFIKDIKKDHREFIAPDDLKNNYSDKYLCMYFRLTYFCPAIRLSKHFNNLKN